MWLGSFDTGLVPSMYEIELDAIRRMDLPLEMSGEDPRWAPIDVLVVGALRRLKADGAANPSVRLAADMTQLALEDIGRMGAVGLATGKFYERAYEAMTMISELRRISALANSGVEITTPPHLPILSCDESLYEMKTKEIVDILRDELVRRGILDNRKGG